MRYLRILEVRCGVDGLSKLKGQQKRLGSRGYLAYMMWKRHGCVQAWVDMGMLRARRDYLLGQFNAMIARETKSSECGYLQMDRVNFFALWSSADKLTVLLYFGTSDLILPITYIISCQF
jgi:hypothetical protein